MKNVRDQIVSVLKKTERSGFEKVVSGIQELGFFSAPASIKYNNNFEGGLALHSYQVYEIAMKLRDMDKSFCGIPEDSIAISCLLHDVCKADIYRKENGRFIKDVSGFPAGHGEKSVIRLLMMGLELTEEEILAIRWHMGIHTLRVKEGRPDGNEAECYSFAKEHLLCRLLNKANSIALYQWNAARWLKDFKHIDTHRSRIKVYEYTQAIVKEGMYISANGNVVSQCSSPTIVDDTYFYRGPINRLPYENKYCTIVEVKNSDCLKVAHDFVAVGRNDVCVLNLASYKYPGGGVLGGCGAQEEYLFRCSDYFMSLYQYHDDTAQQAGVRRNHEFSYPFLDYSGIFSKNVTVFRGGEEEGYPLLDSPWKVNFIAVAARRFTKKLTRLSEPDTVVMKEKIRTIFRIAMIHGQKVLVLGALGCGAFNNPPRHVAELFKEVLGEAEFVKSFEHIVFAIKCDHNDSCNNNYTAFSDVFHKNNL